MEARPTNSPRYRRAAGILLHITSLTGPYGIGDIGPVAHEFIASLATAGQKYWQVLPVVPIGPGNSPYSAPSAFAGNPLLISPDLLVAEGLATADEASQARCGAGARMDFPTVIANKGSLLDKVAHSFRSRRSPDVAERYDRFRNEHGSAWLDEYALFQALKTANEGGHWIHWDERLKSRDPAALSEARQWFSHQMEAIAVVQFLFNEQWRKLRTVAQQAGIRIVGDLPLYVDHDSADVWSNPLLFDLNSDGSPNLVAGVPPDYFSATGQRWGNPIYAWELMKQTGFPWWRQRMSHAASLFDVVRFDHFRGIAAYWAIPADEGTAVRGTWEQGPGQRLLGAIQDELGDLPLLAEDLGIITEDVTALRKDFGLPGMRVAQFGLLPAPDHLTHRPDRYPEDVWAYTGTHDNNTTEGWFWEGNPPRSKWRLGWNRLRLYWKTKGKISESVIKMVHESRAQVAIVPAQDLLGLGAEARMNTPGTPAGNWEWRLLPGQLDQRTWSHLQSVTEASNRSVR